MTAQTTPIFLVGTGRSGTRMIFKLLSNTPGIEIHHEFACTHVQPLACKYFMGLINKETVQKEMAHLHYSAIHYSDAKYWVDSSNKLSWMIEPILEKYPHAKFIHVVRDGRKVTSSFFHKLNDEMYDDKSVKILNDWITDQNNLPEPAPEKKYWWNIPQKGQKWHEEFAQFDQYQRTCYHWTQTIEEIEEKFKNVPEGQKLTVKLEELTSDKEVLKKFLSFFDLEYSDNYFEMLQTPQNVFFPMDFNLSEEELKNFDTICGETMEKMKYLEKETYQMKY